MAQNKNSVYETSGRYVNGGTTEVSRGKTEWWERRVIPPAADDREFTIDEDNHQRPDRLAALVYGESRWAWVILLANNIIDVADEFVIGRTISIPSKDRVQNQVIGQKVGGIETTRNGSQT